jgi:hypothetical protein
MVLSEQQKKDLIERLKKGREQAKEKKLNEATTQEKSKSKSKPEPEPEPAPVKKSNSKKIQVSENESSSDTEDSVQVRDVVSDVKESVKKEFKKTQSVPLEKAFDEMKLKSKPIDIPPKKEKPYLKIKLYKEPSNPNLINKFVNSINETDEPEPVIKHKEAEPKKSVEPEKSEREKHLERLCKLYFN